MQLGQVGNRFKNCLQNIDGIYEIFACHVSEGMLVLRTQDTFLQWTSVFVSSRYFTDRQRHSYEEPIAFDRMEDPNRVLNSMCGGQYAHCGDNKVQYFRLNRLGGEGRRKRGRYESFWIYVFGNRNNHLILQTEGVRRSTLTMRFLASILLIVRHYKLKLGGVGRRKRGMNESFWCPPFLPDHAPTA
jgi:hypothetical protein